MRTLVNLYYGMRLKLTIVRDLLESRGFINNALLKRFH